MLKYEVVLLYKNEEERDNEYETTFQCQTGHEASD